jgi:peroxiredoxin/outer membrane protein assembly factor BamD (BamD/ComL family)
MLAPTAAFGVGKKLVGQKPPEIMIKEWLNTNESYTLGKLKGKIVLIDFWATWCRPCVRAMPHLQKVWEAYKDKGLVVIAISAETRAKVQPFADRYKYTFPFAMDDNRMTSRAYGIKSIPTTYIIAPDGKVAWQGHASSDDVEKTIKALLPKVKESSGSSGVDTESPTKVKLREVTKALQFAAKQAEKGKLASALRMADKVLNQESASEEEKKDAKYIKEEVEKRAADLFLEVDRLLREKMPYEAKELLTDIRRAFSGSDYAKKAQKRIDSINNDEKLTEELEAGKLYVKALQYESDGKKEDAKKYFEQVVEKHPKTEYAKRAKEKLK